jgi:hypothetical protein
MDREATEICERLVLVERSMRRYRAALAAVGLIAAAGSAGPSLVGAAKAPGTVRAAAFEVVDDNGAVRALLAPATGGDGAALALFDKAGKSRIELGVVGDHAVLHLSDKAGKTRAALAVIGDDATVALYDEGGELRAALGNDDLNSVATGSSEHRSASSLVLLNERGRVLWEAP